MPIAAILVPARLRARFPSRAGTPASARGEQGATAGAEGAAGPPPPRPGCAEAGAGSAAPMHRAPLDAGALAALGRRLLPPGPQGAPSAMVAALYRGASVAVTGAGGSIGLELCRHLLAHRPARLLLIEHAEPALRAALDALELPAAASGTALVPLLGNAGDAPLVAGALGAARAEILFHAAAYKHVDIVEANPLAGLRNNTLATRAALEAAGAAGCGRFVLVSTDKAEAPCGAMGASKRLAELLVQGAGAAGALKTAVVRFGNVFGSSGSVVPRFAAQIAAGGPITLTDGRATRYMMRPEAAAELTLRAGALAGEGGVFALDMGAPVRIAALARAMRDTAAERSGGFSRVDIVETGLRPGERLHEAPLPGPGAEASAEAGVFRLPVSGPGRAGGALLVAQLARLDGETNPARLRAEMLRLAGAAPSAQPSRGNADADGSRRTAAPRRTEPLARAS